MSLYEILEKFPQQFSYESLEKDLSSYEGVAFCGVGGSGIVGSIATKLLEHKGYDKPLVVVKDYTLPKFVNERFLVFCISYSGNTEETLSNFQDAISRGIKPVCITSGGKLKELAQKEGCEVYEVPKGYQPRFALGFMLSKLLNLVGISREELEDARENLQENLSKIKDIAKRLSEKLYNYVPVVYATPLTHPIAERWKGQINENAKTPTYYAVLPEMHHNEVMGWSNPLLRPKFSYIIMFDEKDHHRIKLRVEITKKILEDFGVVPELVKGEGNSYLARTLYLLYVADWLSVYLAELYGYDPTEVKIIEKIKQELSNA